MRNSILLHSLVALLLGFGAGRGVAADAAKSSGTKSAVAAADSGTDKTNDWKSLFDGQSLAGWKVGDYAGHGTVSVDSHFKGGPVILLEMGAVMTGITWTNPPPKGEFEITYEAMKLEGSDFFGTITFPVGSDHCSFVVGGWGGGVVGISSLDSMDASENETTKFLNFEKDHWYRVRVRVTKTKIEAWIDKDKIVDVVTTDRRISVRAGEIEEAQPLGFTVYQTKAALRDIRLRQL